MCSAPKAPKMPPMDPLPDPDPIPAPEPLPLQQQAPPPPPLQPMARTQQQPSMPAVPGPVQGNASLTAPPPQSVQGGEDKEPIVKKRKSKRDVLQQQNKGASSLRIKRDKTKSIGSVATGNTGSTGLNIPKS